MCKHAVISPIATPGRMEFARSLGNWRCPVVGSNGAVFTIGLIHCGQRCDLDFVIFAMPIRSTVVARGHSGTWLLSSLLVAVVGVVQDVFEQRCTRCEYVLCVSERAAIAIVIKSCVAIIIAVCCCGLCCGCGCQEPDARDVLSQGRATR